MFQIKHSYITKQAKQSFASPTIPHEDCRSFDDRIFFYSHRVIEYHRVLFFGKDLDAMSFS
jgi:uncharacterized protein (UPF0248 family)